MKGDENRYLVLGKADVVFDVQKSFESHENSKEVPFLSQILNLERDLRFLQKIFCNLFVNWYVVFLHILKFISSLKIHYFFFGGGVLEGIKTTSPFRGYQAKGDDKRQGEGEGS